MERLWHDPVLLLGALFGVMSLLLFAMMGRDKALARSGGRRIPEKRLFLLALLGGGTGGWLGMRLFHHKTKHWYFRLGFPLLATVQLALLAVLALTRP